MGWTSEQYEAVSTLDQWYEKHSKQFIEISGTVGTGCIETIQLFVEYSRRLEQHDVMYLSYDQRVVLNMAYYKHHAYYIDGALYDFHKNVDLDSVEVFNPNTTHRFPVFEYKKVLKKSIIKKYKLIVILDSTLITVELMQDLVMLDMPIILVRDPMLLPSPDSYRYLLEPDIIMQETIAKYSNNTLVHFCNKVATGKQLSYGGFGPLTVISRKTMNVYNMRTCDMIITMSEFLRHSVNELYRSRILKSDPKTINVGDKLILLSSVYNEELTNQEEENIKVYPHKGLVCKVKECRKQGVSTLYTPLILTPDCYYEPFDHIYVDRKKLCGIKHNRNTDIIEKKDTFADVEFAFALTPGLSRVSTWDRITIIYDDSFGDAHYNRMALYTSMTRAIKNITIVK